MQMPECKVPAVCTQIHALPFSLEMLRILGGGQAERGWVSQGAFFLGFGQQNKNMSRLLVAWVAGTMRDLLPRLSELEGHENFPSSSFWPPTTQEKTALVTPSPFQLASKLKSLQDLDALSSYLPGLGNTYLPCCTTHHALGHAESFFFLHFAVTAGPLPAHCSGTCPSTGCDYRRTTAVLRGVDIGCCKSPSDEPNNSQLWMYRPAYMRHSLRFPR